ARAGSKSHMRTKPRENLYPANESWGQLTSYCLLRCHPCVPTAWGEWPIYLVAMPGRTVMTTRTSVVPSSCRTRFCMLAYSFYEGDTRILQYATALAKRGDIVDVIALRRKGQPKHEVL